MLEISLILFQLLQIWRIYQKYKAYQQRFVLRQGNPPPPHKLLRLVHGYRSRLHNMDVWANLEGDWSDFYWLTGEFPLSLWLLVRQISIYVRRGKGRKYKLSLRNQVLLTVIWLRRYPTMHHLSYMFGIRVSGVWKIIHNILPKMHSYLVPRYIKWHTPNTWNGLAGYIPEWPSVVAILDCTPFRISRPKGRMQRLYYRRDRGCMFINWLCVVDVKGFVVYSRPGFMGHLHDSICHRYIRIPALPNGLRIMADQGFANRHPLLLPTLRRGRNVPRPIKRSFRKQRALIERMFGVIKMSYSCCGTRRYRGKRFLSTLICNVSAALSNRRKLMFFRLRQHLP